MRISSFILRDGTTTYGAVSGDGLIVADDALRSRYPDLKALIAAGAIHELADATGDTVAAIGENRKILIFPLEQIPVMARGKGVRLQRYKDGGLSDATTFNLAEGLSWRDPAGRTRTETELAEWLGKRAGAGRMAPRGFPRDNTFT